MKLSKISSAVLVSSLMAASVAQAAVEVSGGVALTNNYLFRGVSQSDNSMAIQGELSAAHESGLYATVWGSSIGFDGGPGLDAAGGGMEGNLLLGYSSSVGDVDYDVGVMRYFYPGADDKFGDDGTGTIVKGNTLSYNEIYASVGYKGATFGMNYSDDYFNESGKFLYTYAGYELELMENLTGSVHVGYNKLFDETEALNNFGTEEYIDYSVGVNYAYSGLDFGLAYVGVDGDGKDAFDGFVNKVVFSVAKSF